MSRKRKKTKFIHEKQYVAEVEVTLTEDESGWSPYLSEEEATKLDKVRVALRSEDFKTASHFGKVYELNPIAN